MNTLANNPDSVTSATGGGILISFIIPVYNTQKYLSACLDSLTAQQGDDLEFVFIDDGSKDSSGAMLDEYAKREKRARVIHKPNAGVSAARNDGMDQALGKWFCFIDSDDIIEKNLTSRVREYLTGGNDIVLFSWNTFYKDDASDVFGDLPSETHICDEDDMLMLCENSLCPSKPLINTPLRYRGIRGVCGCVLRRDIIIEAGLRFNPELIQGEDNVFRLEYLSRCKSAVTICDVLYYYRITPTSSLHRYNEHAGEVVLKLLPALREVVERDYKNSAAMLRSYWGTVVLEARSYLIRFLINPQCELPLEKRVLLHDAFRKNGVIAEGIENCDKAVLQPPFDRLLDAYRIPDARLSFEKARAVLEEKPNPIKALAAKLGVAPALKRLLRRFR